MTIGSNVSSIQAHSSWMDATAHNVANVSTKDSKAVSTVIEEGPTAVHDFSSHGTNLASEMVNMVTIPYAVASNKVAIQTQDQMASTLLNIKG